MVQVLHLLLRRGADINAQDIDWQTPLHYAALCEQVMTASLHIGGNQSCYRVEFAELLVTTHRVLEVPGAAPWTYKSSELQAEAAQALVAAGADTFP